jgi:hypothetical protein
MLKKAILLLHDTEESLRIAMQESENKTKILHIQNSFGNTGDFDV